eukprot:Ihof_evm2s395 gene=Ihof_evmTU2s395
MATQTGQTTGGGGAYGSALTGLCVLGGVLAGFGYMGRPNTEQEMGENMVHRYDNENLIKQYYLRSKDRLYAFYSYYADPSDTSLLPDPLPQHQQPPTLVLEYNNVLTYSEWTPEAGYRVKVRKGAREFLRYLAQFYEIVIYTSVSSQTADPILAGLQGEVPVIFSALYRDSTRYKHGVHIKDLTCLNRDLSKVIMIDTHSDNYSLTPCNGIALDPWNGSSDDNTLVELLPFFVMMATTGLEDVRPVLSYYQGKNVVQTYKDNQKLIMQREEESKKAALQKKATKSKFGFLSSFAPVSSEPATAN